MSEPKASRELREAIAESSVFTMLKYGRCYSDEERSRILGDVARSHPHVVEANIMKLRAQADMLESYLPEKETPHAHP